MNSPYVPEAVATRIDPDAPFDTVIDPGVPSGVWTPDPVASLMPPILRIVSLTRTLNGSGQIRNEAVLYHDRCSVRVVWDTQQVDTRLHRFGLATIRHALTPRSVDGALRIQRLLPVDRPLPSVNLFQTVPPNWVGDRDLVQRAAALWEEMSRPLAHLFNAMLWDNVRFRRYVRGPSSLADHHNGWNGNFRHSVEVAGHARELGLRVPLADVSLLITAGLLHDAGKADEYCHDRARNGFHLSARGELVGHRDTLIEWLAVARETGRVAMPEDMYLALLHVINAAKAAPWLGLRDPRCIEAEILSMADRLSGHEDIHERCAPADGQPGFGRAHPHIGRRTYVTNKKRRE